MTKFLILCVFFFFISFCTGQKNPVVEDVVIDIRDPFTPSQDSLEIWSEVDLNQLLKIRRSDSIPYDRYYLENKLFTGWASTVFPDAEQRYRFMQMNNGKAIWQIDYYQNGNRGADFRFIDGKGIGSERMWHKDGSLYVDSYYVEPDMKDGYHKRWYQNGQLARSAMYYRGVMLFDVLYDSNGVVTEQKGVVPLGN